MRRRRRHPYDALVLSGGGVKGITMLGSMAYLQDIGALDHVTHFVGTSVGAVVATVMAMGAAPRDVFKRHVATFKYTPDIDITRLERNFGLDSGKNLERWIESLVPTDHTFASFYETYGKTLTVSVTNLNSHAAEFCSRHTTPHLSVRLALRMSCSVPLYFSAVKYNGSMYVDGGVACNFPVRHAIECGAARVLGVRFTAPPKEPGHAWTFETFLGALLESSTNRQHPPNATIIHLDTGDVSQPLQFKLSKKEKAALFETGYAQTRLFFKKNQ
jgi:predicted acylesterase/phospholipase RssA